MEAMKVDAKEIGNKLRELRGDKTTQTVADAIGVTQSAMCMYEGGHRIPRDEIKIKICQYYGIDIGFFYGL